jgi:hypothetical protein
MFKNYAFIVKPVKATPSETADPSPKDPIDFDEVAGSVVAAGMLIVGTYVAADTLRQIAVHTARMKIK